MIIFSYEMSRQALFRVDCPLDEPLYQADSNTLSSTRLGLLDRILVKGMLRIPHSHSETHKHLSKNFVEPTFGAPSNEMMWHAACVHIVKTFNTI